MKNQQGLQGANRLFLLQLGITLLMAAGAWLVLDAKTAYSVILGGIVSFLPNAYFARKLFQHQGARVAKQIVNSFYKGEALKILLSIILFTLVFMFISINPIAFFSAYIIVQMAFWFAPLLFVNKQDRPKSD